MAGTLLERHRFFQPLHDMFSPDVQDWFVGIDRMIDDMARRWEGAFASFTHFPESEVERLNDDQYRIRLKVPGYEKSDLKVRLIEGGELVISGETSEAEGTKEKEGWHASFEQRFLLADTMRVDSAKLTDDTLVVDVSFPESARPKEISVPIV